MSFSSEQKKEIIEYTYKSSCCRRSLLSGILFSKATVEGKHITFSLECREYAEYAAKLIKEFYSKDADIYRPSTGGRNIKLSFESPSAAKYVAEIDNYAQNYVGDDSFSVLNVITQRCASCLRCVKRLCKKPHSAKPQRLFCGKLQGYDSRCVAQ